MKNTRRKKRAHDALAPAVRKVLRIGVYGGKFDPIHIGHLICAEWTREHFNLDSVLFVTSANPPHKKTGVLPAKFRHEMVKATLKPNSYFEACDIEMRRTGPSYTVDTLRILKKRLEKKHKCEVELFLMVSAEYLQPDHTWRLDKWYGADELFKLAEILCFPRDAAGLAQIEEWKKNLPREARIHALHCPTPPMSSSMIRERVEQGKSVWYMVAPETWAIIRDRRHYLSPGAPLPARYYERSKRPVDLLDNASDEGRTAAMGIRSILDNDLYKFTMQNGVRLKYQKVRVKYKFTDRRAKGNWTPAALASLKRKVKAMAKLKLTAEERAKGEIKLPWLPRDYWDYLAAYRFDPKEVKLWLENGNLKGEISGFWDRTILWEVPLLALICQTYYEEIDTNWTDEGQDELMLEKSAKLMAAGVPWGDFGTRRRRNFESQERVVRICKGNPNFRGTSNVYLALKYDVLALGTMAHEWIMGHSALFSLRHANRYALHAWNDIYKGDLGTALPDTYGTDAFLRDFDGVLARLFDSVRHDSGDPYAWAEKMIAHYTKLGLNWKEYPLGFTDGNTADSAIAIYNWVKAKGGLCWFGIGTSMSNDFGPESPALSIVIKLAEVIDESGTVIQVVKLSDVPEKASGDRDAIREAKYVHLGIPLDAAA